MIGSTAGTTGKPSGEAARQMMRVREIETRTLPALANTTANAEMRP